MSKRIQMGNDEFILYVRKRGQSERSTSDLGERIWIWIREQDPAARKVVEDQPCHWGDQATFIHAGDLPKTATQFEFDRALLPSLYTYLDTL